MFPATVVAARAPEPMWMNWRRVTGFLDMNFSDEIKAWSVYGLRLCHRKRSVSNRFSKTRANREPELKRGADLRSGQLKNFNSSLTTRAFKGSNERLSRVNTCKDEVTPTPVQSKELPLHQGTTVPSSL